MILFGIMALIFMLSAQKNNDSQMLSHAISDRVESVIESRSVQVFDTEKAKEDYIKKLKDKTNTAVRKNAHAFLFALFGLFAFLVFRQERRSEYSAAINTLFFGMIYAMSDELHQALVEGRSGQMQDVCVDVFGIALILMLIYFIGRKTQKHGESK